MERAHLHVKKSTQVVQAAGQDSQNDQAQTGRISIFLKATTDLRQTENILHVQTTIQFNKKVKLEWNILLFSLVEPFSILGPIVLFFYICFPNMQQFKITVQADSEHSIQQLRSRLDCHMLLKFILLNVNAPTIYCKYFKCKQTLPAWRHSAF